MSKKKLVKTPKSKKKTSKFNINHKEKEFRFGNLKPRNEAQKLYLQSLRESKLTICSGAAGTGKTFVSTYVALEKLLNGEVDKIIITRPIVEAGEKLGFLPGTFEEKVNPYLLPIMDCFEDHIGLERTKALMESGAIEIAPLAYMRGRSISNAVVLGDEMSNSTKEQIKMLLTRQGRNSFFFVSGDETQCDLKIRSENGLSWIMDKLQPCEEIGKVTFERKDIVREPIIEKILNQLDD